MFSLQSAVADLHALLVSIGDCNRPMFRKSAFHDINNVPENVKSLFIGKVSLMEYHPLQLFAREMVSVLHC